MFATSPTYQLSRVDADDVVIPISVWMCPDLAVLCNACLSSFRGFKVDVAAVDDRALPREQQSYGGTIAISFAYTSDSSEEDNFAG